MLVCISQFSNSSNKQTSPKSFWATSISTLSDNFLYVTFCCWDKILNTHILKRKRLLGLTVYKLYYMVDWLQNRNIMTEWHCRKQLFTSCSTDDILKKDSKKGTRGKAQRPDLFLQGHVLVSHSDITRGVTS